MRCWFSYCLNYSYDSDTAVDVGVHWYKHKNTHPKYKSWFGFTVTFYLLKYLINFTFVNDYNAYDTKINAAHRLYKAKLEKYSKK